MEVIDPKGLRFSHSDSELHWEEGSAAEFFELRNSGAGWGWPQWAGVPVPM